MDEARRIASNTRYLESSAAEALSIEKALTDAVRRQALSLEFQPQFDLRTGAGVGAEALARWTRSSGKTIAPSVFIPIAERTGMMHALGTWVLEAACAAAHGWRTRGGRSLTLSVNVSALQVNEDFCSVIGDCLRHTGFPAGQLELEIAEGALLENAAPTIECLKQWKALGVRIALDDFGKGPSSVGLLSRLPVDRLKVAQSLIQRLPGDKKSAITMRSILALGTQLGVDIIAKGTETEPQLQALMDLGCPHAQGYLLGRPMSARRAQMTLRKAWGNRPMPVVRDTRIAIGECHVQ